jgi:hypothetical protein
LIFISGENQRCCLLKRRTLTRSAMLLFAV